MPATADPAQPCPVPKTVLPAVSAHRCTGSRAGDSAGHRRDPRPFRAASPLLSVAPVQPGPRLGRAGAIAEASACAGRAATRSCATQLGRGEATLSLPCGFIQSFATPMWRGSTTMMFTPPDTPGPRAAGAGFCGDLRGWRRTSRIPRTVETGSLPNVCAPWRGPGMGRPRRILREGQGCPEDGGLEPRRVQHMVAGLGRRDWRLRP